MSSQKPKTTKKITKKTTKKTTKKLINYTTNNYLSLFPRDLHRMVLSFLNLRRKEISVIFYFLPIEAQTGLMKNAMKIVDYGNVTGGIFGKTEDRYSVGGLHISFCLRQITNEMSDIWIVTEKEKYKLLFSDKELQLSYNPNNELHYHHLIYTRKQAIYTDLGGIKLETPSGNFEMIQSSVYSHFEPFFEFLDDLSISQNKNWRSIKGIKLFTEIYQTFVKCFPRIFKGLSLNILSKYPTTL